MPDQPEIFRTDAYVVMKDGKETVKFWSLDPVFNEIGKFAIRTHELYEKGSYSALESRSMPLAEALGAIEEIERGAARQYPRAPASYKDHRWIGSNYRDARHISEHPLRAGEKREEAMKRLRAAKPKNLKLKL